MALQFTEREFIPVLLGGDINAYSVARAFYEEYQVKSLVFGKYQTGPAPERITMSVRLKWSMLRKLTW